MSNPWRLGESFRTPILVARDLEELARGIHERDLARRRLLLPQIPFLSDPRRKIGPC